MGETAGWTLTCSLWCLVPFGIALLGFALAGGIDLSQDIASEVLTGLLVIFVIIVIILFLPGR